jgi:hypothetical protein
MVLSPAPSRQPQRPEDTSGDGVGLAVYRSSRVALRATLDAAVLDGLNVAEVTRNSVELRTQRFATWHWLSVGV